MSQNAQLPDQPIMKYVHPADRLRPWFGVAVGLVVLAGMLTFSILGRNFGTLDHLKLLNSAGVWLTMSLIEADRGLGRDPGAPGSVRRPRGADRAGGRGTTLHLLDPAYRPRRLRNHNAGRLV